MYPSYLWENTAYCKLIDQNNGHLIISLVHKSLDTRSKLSPLTFSNGPIIIRQAREPQDHGDLSDRDWPGAEIKHDQTKQANKINTRLWTNKQTGDRVIRIQESRDLAETEEINDRVSVKINQSDSQAENLTEKNAIKSPN